MFLNTIMDMLLQLHKGSQPLAITSSSGQIDGSVQGGKDARRGEEDRDETGEGGG